MKWKVQDLIFCEDLESINPSSQIIIQKVLLAPVQKYCPWAHQSQRSVQGVLLFPEDPTCRHAYVLAGVVGTARDPRAAPLAHVKGPEERIGFPSWPLGPQMNTCLLLKGLLNQRNHAFFLSDWALPYKNTT